MLPKPPTPPLKTPVKPLVFGKPEEKSLWAKIMPWAFVVAALVVLGAMIAMNKPQKSLSCQNNVSGAGSFSAFGTCTEN